ncbi:HNH endonuclease [Rhodococcus sp. KB6]|uniref:HNH endonuclease n=1 Tax=Rhodococcus sp. KB6 TaxID=1752066 RepID=UPI00071829AE|nr:HNH endonuclease [Rhodococcus sp. KB6]
MAWTNGGATRTTTKEHRRWAKAVLRRDGYRCVDCGYQGTAGKGDVNADHQTPVAFGGKTTLDNGATRCVPCHKKKTGREAAEGRRRKRQRPAQRHPGVPVD